MPTVLNFLLVGVVHDELLVAALGETADAPATVTRATALNEALAAAHLGHFDAVLIATPAGEEALAGSTVAVRDLARSTAVLMLADGPFASPADALETVSTWSRLGVEDVLDSGDLVPAVLARRVRGAIERKRVELASRQAYATDLATGLPHRQQLVEHMSQLLALREREPVPMAVLALRIEGFSTTEVRLGAQAADALRRKIGVRLRAAVRASDVVAALDEVSYAVLLGALLAPADADRVAGKLAEALKEPYSVGGVSIAVAVATGLAHAPEDGTEPETLLRRAVSAALDAPAQGRIGMANFEEAGAATQSAANDD